MEKVIGKKKETMFRFNCCARNDTGEKICDFQVSGEGNREEMVRLHNVLLDNGFCISSVVSADREIPIVERT